jgi:hypothetical protein
MRARRTGRDVDAHPGHFLLPARLAADARAPHPGESFLFEVSYGYHFDAHKVGALLAGRATEKLGVVHRQTRVATVERALSGNVATLICDDGARIAGDLFVDSSGFRSLIFGALDVPFIGYGDVLFNDRAVVMPPPRGTLIASQTRATTLPAGWAWDILLTSRTGNGYVYSSRHVSEAQAEAELRAHLGVGDAGSARHIKMRVGRVGDSCSDHALAVGLAQGFLEPLEATALHLVIATVEAFLDAVDQGGVTSDTRAGLRAEFRGTRYFPHKDLP